MNEAKISKNGRCARPILALINHIENTIPKSIFVVYYKNYTHRDDNSYKNINELRQLFLLHQELQFKVVDFSQESSTTYFKSTAFEVNDTTIQISATYKEYELRLSGSILNRAESETGVVDLTMLSKQGYDSFYKFRKKYKTLENITKSIDFKIDHRIRMISGGKEYRFDLEQRKREHYYLTLIVFSQPVIFYLQEITSIQDFTKADVIAQTEVALSQILALDSGYTVKINYSNGFQVNFLFDLVLNQNIATAEMSSIRIFQTSTAAPSVKIGSEKNINLNTCLKLSPVVGDKFFDFQWGNLNQNLGKVQGKSQVYDHLDKISKSDEKYHHFINQQILDVQDCSYIFFDVGGELLRVPIIYLMQGLNIISKDKVTLKFFIDSIKSKKPTKQFNSKSGHRRLYEMNVLEIFNMNKINKMLEKRGVNKFQLKIINETTVFYVPFDRVVASRAQFKKQVKELATKQELSFKANGIFYWLQAVGKGDQLAVIQTQGILPFYLLQMTSSAPMSFQIIIEGAVQMEGSLQQQKIIENQHQQIIHLVSALESNAKIGIVATFQPITQNNDSVSTFYTFKQRLSFAQAGQTGEITYDVQVQFEKDARLKSLRSKLHPQLNQETQVECHFLREFSDRSGVIWRDRTLQFELKIRKMFYNEELSYFDNEIIFTKTVVINPTIDQIKEGKALMLRIEKQCYEGVEVDFYDSNIGKRLKYYLEIFASNNQFLDHRDSSYRFKIPRKLWQFISVSHGGKQQGESDTYELTVHLNRKKNSTGKYTFNSNFQQQIILDHYNYNDGVSLLRNGTDLAYSKFIKAIKLRCDIVDSKIGWSPHSDWYFGVMTLQHSNFYFLAQRMFDPYEDKGKDGAESDRSRRTVSRDMSHRSDKHKIDPLAKTINNLDLFNLKKKKNDIVAQGRILTTRYVKLQERIADYTKKTQELQEKMKKKAKQDQDKKINFKAVSHENKKAKQFYRSICECGERDPQFNGYCSKCLQKLKDRYEQIFKDYKQKCYAYETMVFGEYNQQQKIERLKNHIEALTNREQPLEADDGFPADFLMKNMESKGLKKFIGQMGIEIFQLDEEKGSLLENANWQMKILEEKITKQDTAIYKLSQQYDVLKTRLSELAKLLKLEDAKKA